jgi:hypothetical protein
MGAGRVARKDVTWTRERGVGRGSAIFGVQAPTWLGLTYTSMYTR